MYKCKNCESVLDGQKRKFCNKKCKDCYYQRNNYQMLKSIITIMSGEPTLEKIQDVINGHK